MEDKKKRIYTIVACSTFWWIVAHGFATVNMLLSHDSLNEFFIFNSVEDKIALGRFFEPMLRLLMGEYVTIPWLTYIVALLMLIIAVYFTAKIFELKSFVELFFLSAVYVTNVTVTACIATYSHDLAGDMVALALSVYAVYLWTKLCQKIDWKNLLLSVLSITTLLGFYQAYLSVTIVLVIIYSILVLIRNENFLKVVKSGLLAIAIIIVSFGVYMLLVKTCCAITRVELNKGNYNSLSNLWTSDESILKKVIIAYVQVIWTFVAPTYSSFTKDLKSIFIPNIYNFQLCIRTIGNVALAFLDVISLIIIMSDKKIEKYNKLLVILLIIVLPIGMEISYIGSGMSHELMRFSYWLFYLLSYLFVKYVFSDKTKRYSLIVVTSISIFILCNVQTSNLVYVKKEMIKDSTLSTMTRVLYKIEDLDGYDEIETPVAFIGGVDVQKGMPGFNTVNAIIGVDTNSQITYQATYKRYFSNVLQYDLNVCSDTDVEAIKNTKEVKEMPIFPKKGSIKIINDVVVVKLSDIE